MKHSVISIKVLENKGFLAKEQDGKDKRITRLQITTLGDDLVKLLIPSSLLKSYCEQRSRENRR